MDDLKQRLWDAIAFTAKPIHELEHRLAVDSLARIERLEAALRVYGDHQHTCPGRVQPFYDECTCGWCEARRALDEEDTDAS